MRRYRAHAVLGLALAFVAAPSLPSAASSTGPCAAPANPIVAENCLPGTPSSQWDVVGAGDGYIQGFATQFSVDAGETVHFKVKSIAAYHVDVYRLGYYAGNGARFITTLLPSVIQPQAQPPCLNDPTTGLVDCGNWSESASWSTPTTAVSGVYIAKLVRNDTGGASQIPFVVRDDASHSDLVYQTSDETWQAYNTYGGNSLYNGGPATNPGRAYMVSYNRPITLRRKISAGTYLFSAEYPMIRFLEANGYDLSYISGADTDRAPVSMLEQHKVFLSVGHDEYWSGAQRANVEAARNAGVNLAFFSGNEVFWKTRWQNSIDGSGTPYRTLVCYKETLANAKIDPTPVWTGTWRDPRFSPPADGGRPENALSGTISTVNNGATTAIRVPGSDARLRLWRNTSVAGIAPGSTATLAPSTLGYEWDEDLDNGSRPPGEIDLSSTTVSVPARLVDYGSTYKPGIATHSITLYRSGSALVFGAGTIQWSFGLDGVHDNPGTPDKSMRQATVNLFADMGVQPGSLQADLVAATASTDTTPPTATVTSPGNGATVAEGVPLTVRGTATDSGGGRVAGVEVSTDGGATWHPATGHEAWSYVFTPQHTGPLTIRSRATDDSVNTGAASADVHLTVVPATTVLVPTGGAALAANKVLDASASASATTVEFHASGGSLSDAVVSTGSPSPYGWIGTWDTRTVADGAYTLSSVARDGSGNTGRSAAVSVTVDNTPPTTAMVFPASGAVLSGTASYLDASASDNMAVTRVEFRATGGSLSKKLLGTGSRTVYGWLFAWNTKTVANGSYTITSVAFDAAGNSTTSAGLNVSVAN